MRNLWALGLRLHSLPLHSGKGAEGRRRETTQPDDNKIRGHSSTVGKFVSQYGTENA